MELTGNWDQAACKTPLLPPHKAGAHRREGRREVVVEAGVTSLEAEQELAVVGGCSVQEITWLDARTCRDSTALLQKHTLSEAVQGWWFSPKYDH